MWFATTLLSLPQLRWSLALAIAELRIIFYSDGDKQQDFIIETSTEMCSDSVLLVDKACETMLNLVNMLGNAKRIEHQLKMKIKCQQDTLQKLQTEHDVMRQRFYNYDESKQIQDLWSCSNQPMEVIKMFFLSRTKSAITAT